jgi:hypothetical protein
MEKKAPLLIFTFMKKLSSKIKKFLLYRLMRSCYYLLSRIYLFIQCQIYEAFYTRSVRVSKQSGVSAIKRDPELIISLTTIPERIRKVSLCLDTLLRQSLKPDRVILWLSQSDEPDQPRIDKQTLPDDLLRLVDRGLEIRWCKDIRSYRKIIPTLHAHPNALIVTADDDIFYPRDWLKALTEAYHREPEYIHCHRAHLMKYSSAGVLLPYRQWEFLAPGYLKPSLDLFPTSGGGVLYAPGHLHAEVLNERAFLNLCPMADDVWLKAMSLLNNVLCKKVTPLTFSMIEIRISRNRTLSSDNLERDGNDPQIRAVGEVYGVFPSAGKLKNS